MHLRNLQGIKEVTEGIWDSLDEREKQTDTWWYGLWQGRSAVDEGKQWGWVASHRPDP